MANEQDVLNLCYCISPGFKHVVSFPSVNEGLDGSLVSISLSGKYQVMAMHLILALDNSYSGFLYLSPEVILWKKGGF